VLSLNRLTVAALAVLAVGPQAASAATLKGDYRFAGTLASSCCGAPPLTDLGPNSFGEETVDGSARTVLAFPLSSGVSMPAGVIPSDAYSIAVQFRLQDVTGYRRLVDFSTSSSDRGLYDLSGQLNFYPITTGTSSPAPIAANTYAHVVLTRDTAGQVTGYVDGDQEISFTDAGGDAVFQPGSDVRFFKDDAVIGGEESAGAVARIRVYDGALTPAEVAAISGKTLADLPPPEIGKDVNIQAASGRVLVAVPSSAARAAGGRASQKGLEFVPLQQARQVPVGSFLDTRRGSVQMVSATGSGRRTQSGRFSAGLFQVLQARARRAKGLTELRLKGSSFDRCRASGGRAGAALSRRAIRRLRASARGRFRTRGRNSSATVRGTVWITTDRCDGTLTKVTRGKVAVRDLRRRRTITLTAGKSYLARAPR
jgi:concanavalin A-like lectin/glucanase superfamily protein